MPSVLIPAYNEATTIRSLVEKCLKITPNVVVVDDGSSDGTPEAISDLPIHLIRLEKNAGKGAALKAGFTYLLNHCTDGVITLDGDGQHDPSNLPHFFEIAKKHPDDFILGARTQNVKNAPRERLLANKIADFFISWAANKKIKDTQSGFRYYPILFLQHALPNYHWPDRFAFEVRILIAAVQEYVTIRYVDIQSTYPKEARHSHYLPIKDTWRIIRVVAKIILKRFIKKPNKF